MGQANESWMMAFGLREVPKISANGNVHLGLYKRECNENKSHAGNIGNLKRDKIIALYADGLLEWEIEDQLDASQRYVRRVLVAAKMIDYVPKPSRKACLVVCYKDGVEIGKYQSGSEASHATGIDSSAIYRNLRGDSKGCFGYVFKYDGDSSDKHLVEYHRGWHKNVVRIREDGTIARFVSIKQAIEYSGISKSKFKYYIDTGKKINGCKYYTEEVYKTLEGGLK